MLAIYLLLIFIALILALFVCCWCFDEDDRPDQPAESTEQRVARAWAEWQALAARAEAALMGQAAAPPVLLPLPYFPYAAQGDKPSETVVCAICLEPLRPGQLCREVPPCRHVFHGDCLEEWARSNCSCPLCRAKIVPGSD
jgi:hypothetical protein